MPSTSKESPHTLVTAGEVENGKVEGDLAVFAPAADLDEPYGSRFALEVRDLELVEDQRQETANCRSALWRLTCRKALDLS